MSAFTDELLDQSICVNRCIPDGDKLGVLIFLFAKIANVSMPIDTDSLQQSAVCVNRCIPQGDKLGVLIYLASQILASGGPVVGGGAVLCGDADPVAPPTQPCSVYINRNGGIPRVWTWDAILNQWINILA